MQLKSNELEALTKLKNILLEQEYFIDFLVFGSKAIGLSTSESDIDVLIIVKNNNYEVQDMIDDIIFDINIQYDCLISAVIYDLDELQNGPMSESPLYKSALKEGVRL
jgi:predicted nucleotidyltransferase